MPLHITILGLGNVGKQICSQLILNFTEALSINLMDPDKSVEGAFLDLQEAAAMFPQHQLSWNSASAFQAADFIIHCAGATVPQGKSRLVAANASIQITEQIFLDQTFDKSPFIIVLANPVELITHITQKITGLPMHHVMGTGTLLDSLRMQHYIRQDFPNFQHPNVVLLGEHGSKVFLSQQLSTIDHKPINEVCKPAEITTLINKVKVAADSIKATQGATIYGVSACALKIFYQLQQKEVESMPLSIALPSDLKSLLGMHQNYLSLMANVNIKGATPIKNYQPGPNELDQLRAAAETLEHCIPEHYKK